MSKANVEVVARHVGLDISGHVRILAASEVRHALQSHGNAEREAARGQKPIGKADFACIPVIVEQADAIELKGQPKAAKPRRLVYTARIGADHYEYVESIHPGGRILALRTIRKW